MGNLYFLDQTNHRILKIAKNGDFIRQIGGIGQGEDDLFAPLGLYIKDGCGFVLNNIGRELKIFPLEGDYLSSFKVEGARVAGSLCVHDKFIFIGVRYMDEKNYNRRWLIIVFNKEGKKIPEIGKIIKCASRIGYLVFNEIFMSISDNKMFGAFCHRQVVFCYGIDGQEHFFINMENLAIE